jgi:toxin YoeB
MKIQFTEEAWKDFEWFLDKDKRIVKRIRELLKDIGRHPEEGIGKPERLRFQLSGCWVPAHHQRAPAGLQGR